MRRIILAIAVLAAGCPESGLLDDDDTVDDDDAGDDDDWEDLLDRRDQALIDLGEPVVDCVARVDTDHPAFHGCIDWHSSVHGTWALHVLARLLEDDSYLDAADAVLDAASVAGELADLDQNALGWEIPYGYSWFLDLAREREAAGRDDLAPLAQTVATDLGIWLFGLEDDALIQQVFNDAYGNASWALLGLWRWAEHVGDVTLAERLVDRAIDIWLPLGDVCLVADEADHTVQFFPPCLHRMMALDALLPVGAARDTWLEQIDTQGVPDLQVVDDPTTDHGAGLNFSRAWGLWSLYDATGDTAWRSLYVDHVVTHLDRPEYWAEDYRAHSHWIPQFGIRALSLTYE